MPPKQPAQHPVCNFSINIPLFCPPEFPEFRDNRHTILSKIRPIRTPAVFRVTTRPAETTMFPALCMARGGSMTQFWLRRWKRKSPDWASRKLLGREQEQPVLPFAICPPPSSCLEGRCNAGWRAAILRYQSDKITKVFDGFGQSWNAHLCTSH